MHPRPFSKTQITTSSCQEAISQYSQWSYFAFFASASAQFDFASIGSSRGTFDQRY